MTHYFSFILALLRAVVSFDLFTGLMAVLFVAGCFRLVWGLCAPRRFSVGAQD